MVKQLYPKSKELNSSIKESELVCNSLTIVVICKDLKFQSTTI
jgi:hypothetical protein